MNKTLIVLIFSCIIIKSHAQFSAEDFTDKASYNISMVFDNKVGNFNKTMASKFINSRSSGLSIQYLRNPKYKRDQWSKIMIGGELGFYGKTQDSFFLNPSDGSFFMTHKAYWINGVMKFRPILSPTKWNPFAEAFVGPRFYSSKMFESQGNNQSTKLQSFNSQTLAYGLTAGIGRKMKNFSKATYIELAFTYSEANSVLLINRNKVGIDANYNIVASKSLVNPQNLLWKIGITSFL